MVRPLLTFFFVTFSTMAWAGCMDQSQLKGVNLAGAEFGIKQLPGVLNRDYAYPLREDLVFFKQAGMNVIRLPFRWERIQNKLMSPLNEPELAELQKIVNWGREMDLCILLDIHNFGTYYGTPIGADEVPIEAFIDVWQRLANRLGEPAYVMLGLMNEPSAVNVQEWPHIAQKALLALRKNGVTHFILVPSPRWSGAHEWTKRFGDQSPAEMFASFSDPLNRYAIELHQYADSNYSGIGPQCIAKERIEKIMAAVNAAARPRGARFFLGEFGAAENQACLDDLQVMVLSMQDRSIWLGWAYWAAGRRWQNYAFSIQPKEQPKQWPVISSSLNSENSKPAH